MRDGDEGGGFRTHSCHGSMLPSLSIMFMAAESWTHVMTRWRPLRSPRVIAAFLASSPTGTAGVIAEAWLSSVNRIATLDRAGMVWSAWGLGDGHRRHRAGSGAEAQTPGGMAAEGLIKCRSICRHDGCDRHLDNKRN